MDFDVERSHAPTEGHAPTLLTDCGSSERTLADGFTAHNIVLPDGSHTRPGATPIACGQRARGALRIAKMICPPSAQRRPRVVDLGCLEGGYAVEFARAGYDVLGVEARTDSFARCNYVRRKLGLENLAFVQDDVRNVDAYGAFDIVFCAGLLYHMDYPIAFLRQLGDITSRLLLLQTHYAENVLNPHYQLSAITEHEGVLGRWLIEAPEGEWSSVEDMEASLWASWRNAASFWPLKRHLLKAVQDAGFPVVCEQFDTLDDITEDPYVELHSRSMFVGVKPEPPDRPHRAGDGRLDALSLQPISATRQARAAGAASRARVLQRRGLSGEALHCWLVAAAADPFDGEAAAAIDELEKALAAGGPAAEDPFRGARSFTVLADIVELTSEPSLLATFTERFDPDDDATLVIHAPGMAAAEVEQVLIVALEAVGLGVEGGADMVALPDPERIVDRHQLEHAADALLRDGSGPELRERYKAVLALAKSPPGTPIITQARSIRPGM